MENINNVAKYLQVTILEKILNNIPRKAKLEKIKIKGTIIYKTPEVAAEKYNISRCLYFDKYNEMVIKFSKKLEDKCSHCNLSSFYDNMKTLEVYDKTNNSVSLMLKLSKSLGGYSIIKNKIFLMNLKSYDEYETVLNHELLHLSGRKKTGNIYFHGFAQLDTETNKSYGTGLNEGYTELLNQRYFSKNDTQSYKRERECCEEIEKIVGQKKMEQLYFESDLYGLIEELSKYCTKEEAVNLIQKLTKLCLTSNRKKRQKIQDMILLEIDRIQRNKITKEIFEELKNEKSQLNETLTSDSSKKNQK